MKTGFNLVVAAGAVFAGVLGIGVLISPWERPPLDVKQIGYRGVAMEQVVNPRAAAATATANAVPKAIDPAPSTGKPARTVYKNVPVLGDLPEDQFMRLMQAMTEWVAPDQGCGYCHNVENLADDSPYAKVVSRRMLQMTNHINRDWTSHVGQTGVTCYTCHRGNPVPKNIWFDQPEETRTTGWLGYRAGQNAPSAAAGLTSLPSNPSAELKAPSNLRVVAQTALPTTKGGASIQSTEGTYSVMMHMSQSLNVNCTFCHNSRNFTAWDESTPQRTTAWHGIAMVRGLNGNYLDPLKASYPANRLGPQGDAPKANCATCHQGVSKPLLGAQMLKDYPELRSAR
jgi:photosynthetic reaction center cytochrome c subunit